MGQAMIVTGQPNYVKSPASSSVAASYTAPAVTLTKPTSANSCLLYDFQEWQTNTFPSLLRIMPMSSINNGTSVGMRVIGWNNYVQTSGTPVYVPTILGDFTLTYTSGTVPSLSIDSTTLFQFSAITQAVGTPGANLYSPATASGSDTAPASIFIDTAGSQYVTVAFRSSGTPTMFAFWYAV